MHNPCAHSIHFKTIKILKELKKIMKKSRNLRKKNIPPHECSKQTSSRKFYNLFGNDNHDIEKKKDDDDGSREE